ncbi:MAG: hypothetical protein AAF125_04260 [Chloroflexota bacterium]
MQNDEMGELGRLAEGRAMFDRAHFQAFWEEVSQVMLNKPVGLLNFDEVKAKLHLRDQTYRGLRDIEIERIVGSVGRNKEFTKKFLPRSVGMSDRWSRVYAHVNSMTGVPPIDVFQVDDVYFVRDGNHRVSIARQMGNKTIEAYVTELHTPVNLQPDMTKLELEAAVAYANFLDDTGLDRTRPKQEPIELSEPHQYYNLREHIRLVQHVMEARLNPDADIKFEDAAMSWYDHVYEPCVKLIRKYNLLDQFPKQTEGDLYIWIIGHFQRLYERYGDDADQVRLSNALVDFLAENHIPVPKSLLTEDEDDLSDLP